MTIKHGIGDDVTDHDPQFIQQFRDIAERESKKVADLGGGGESGKQYVVLWSNQQYYGGPEEGGWYGWDHSVVCWARVGSSRAAEAIRRCVMSEMIDKQNADLDESRINGLAAQYNEAVARDPSADLDGPEDAAAGLYENYSVGIQEEIPDDEYGPRHYE